MLSAHFKKASFWLLLILIFITGTELMLRAAAQAHILWIRSGQNQSIQKEGLKLLFLGESTTAWGMADSYPAVLGRLLQKKYPNKPVFIINEGVPAGDTAKILNQVEAHYQKHRPDFVFTMMGINDFLLINEESQNFFTRFLTDLRIVKFARTVYQALPQEAVPGKQLKKNYIPRNKYPYSGPPITAMQEQTLGVANIAFNEMDYKRAQEIIAPAIQSWENTHFSILLLAGRLELRLNSREKALKIFRFIAGKTRNPNDLSDIAHDYFLNFGIKGFSGKIMREFAEKALTLDKNHPFSHWAVGCAINAQGKGEEASGIKHLQEAEKLGIVLLDTYVCLANMQERTGDLKAAISTLERAKGVDGLGRAYIFLYLVDLYLRTQQTALAESTFNEAKTELPGNFLLDSIAAKFSNGNAKRQNFGYGNFLENPTTQKNYRAIAAFFLAKNIKVMAVQYPMIPVDPLPKILADLPVPVVSNQENFTEALKKQPYEELFTDRFAENFGHFSPAGSQLVAEAILRRLEELRYFP